MKILQLCLRVPYPPNDGGNIAMHNLAQSLVECGCKVDMLAFNTKKHFVPADKIDEKFKTKFRLQTVYIDATVKWSDAFFNLFSNKSYNVSRFISVKFRNKLEQLLVSKPFDVILIESLFMTPYIDSIRKHSGAKIVLHAHNVEFVIWQRLLFLESNILKKWYMKLLVKRLRKYEIETFKKLDAIMALTNDDAEIIRLNCNNASVFTIPVGIDINKYNSSSQYEVSKNIQQKCLTIFHLGSMDWMPNIEGVDWFLNNVWELLHEKQPHLILYLAGKEMPQHIFQKAGTHLKVEGRVEDSLQYILNKQIMIVPLFSGSGMRVKILEGMAAGKCIVSTTIGCEGINYTEDHNIMIANTAQQFIDCITFLNQHPKKIIEIGLNAKRLAASDYNFLVLGKKTKEIFERLILVD